jgi:hypothetical protein
MAMRIFVIIGLIGGIIALVGIFTPAVTESGWLSVSAWDSITKTTIMGEVMPCETYFCLAFAGAAVALLGALTAVAVPQVKALWAILAIGGILAIVGTTWAFSDIETCGIISYGWGLYLTLGGGILALIGALSGGVLAFTGALGSKE